MNVAEVLNNLARNRPDGVAIIPARGPQITFAQLDRAAARAAGLLHGAGLRPGDAVLLFQPMSVDLYVALAAVFRLGLTALFLDPSAGREHIARCCVLQPPRALIASTRAHLLRLVSPALRAIPIKFVIGWPIPGAVRWSRADQTPPHEAIFPCEPQTPALLTFTSGSTGEPRAAVRTHGLLLAQHRVLDRSLCLKPGDVDLTTMPIVLLANLASGVTSLIPDADLRRPASIDPAAVVAQLQRYLVVSTAASPALLERLAYYCAARNITLPGLRKVFTGGAPVFPHLLDQVRRLAPNAAVTAVYGSTEAEPIAHIAHHEISDADRRAMLGGRGLLAGVPVAEIRVRILGDDGGPGEIAVSGDHVIPGYLHGKGDEEAKFRADGVLWHRTGDAGYFDDRGRLWLLGRCRARIEDRHGVLYPFAAEAAVYQDARVRRAALVAHEGRRVLALEFWDGRGQPNREMLDRELGWAHLDEVRICKTIPVDPRHNAKVDYPALQRMLFGTIESRNGSN